MKVPDRHVPAFQTILEMGESDFSALFAALNGAEWSARRSLLVDLVHKETGLCVSNVKALIDAVMELAAVGYRNGLAAQRMAARVTGSSQFKASEDIKEHFAYRIESLLSCDVVRLRSKASSIGAEHERIFVKARVLTDLRPLFDGNDVERLEPQGALLSHTLVLHFIGPEGRHGDFYVVLDDEDIEVLQHAAVRAAKKSEALKRKLQASGLVYISSEE